MTNEHVKILESKLLHGQDFDEIFEYFLANFGDHERFTAESKKVKIEFITTMVVHACNAFFRKNALRVMGLSVVYHTQLNIFHGVALIEDHQMLFFYCRRIRKGMLVLNNIRRPQTEFIRITPQSLSGEADNLDKLLDNDEYDFNLN